MASVTEGKTERDSKADHNRAGYVSEGYASLGESLRAAQWETLREVRRLWSSTSVTDAQSQQI